MIIPTEELSLDQPETVSENIFTKHFDGPLFLVLLTIFTLLLKTFQIIKVVIFRMKYLPSIDQSGAYALEEVVLALEKRNIAAVIVDLQPQPLRILRGINLIPGLIPENYIFDSFEKCMEWLEKELNQSQGDYEMFFEELSKKL